MGLSAIDENDNLTEAAMTWQAGLVGITPQQLGNGLKQAIMSREEWQPSLPKFREMCLHRDDVPTVSEIAKILIASYRSDANVVKIYKHPIVFEIALRIKNRDFEFRNSSWVKCEAIIKPIYDELLVSGWQDFKPEHYEEHKRLAAPKPTPEQQARAKDEFNKMRRAIWSNV